MLFELYSDGESESVKVLIPQPCPTLCNPMGCSPPGSSVHWISQARTLEWLPIPPSGDLPDLGIQPMSPAASALAGSFFYS